MTDNLPSGTAYPPEMGKPTILAECLDCGRQTPYSASLTACPACKGQWLEARYEPETIAASNNPIPNTQDKDKTPLSESRDSSPPSCPIQDIVKIYHEELPMLPMVRVMTKARETQIRQRWREEQKRQTLEWWRKFVAYVSKSDFLTGKTEKKIGKFRGWLILSGLQRQGTSPR